MDDLEVYVDSRENGPRNKIDTRKERALTYYKEKGHTALITTLEYGDYLFRNSEGKTVAYEYKTMADYMSSLYDGSLFEEASNQSEVYDFAYVVIEGDVREYIKSAWNKWTIRNKYYGRYDQFYTRTLSVYYGSLRRLRKFTSPIECYTEEHCFSEMLLQSEKCFDNKIYSGCKRSIQSKSSVEYFLSGCSGISFKLIENITKTLPLHNLSDLLKVTVEDLMSVPLIGEKKALRIYEWIRCY